MLDFLYSSVLSFIGKGRPVLEWSKRVRIAIGSAKGLAYLHEDCERLLIFQSKHINHTLHIFFCFFFWLSTYLFSYKGHPKIIHRDIKSANILLDDEYEAQAINKTSFTLYPS